jgi:hypothetical protein
MLGRIAHVIESEFMAAGSLTSVLHSQPMRPLLVGDGTDFGGRADFGRSADLRRTAYSRAQQRTRRATRARVH